MKHARADYQRIQDPDGKIPADEPVFLLRGQDKAAPKAVRAWADHAHAAGASAAIVANARAHADEMDRWHAKMKSGAKTPDMP